MFSVLLASSPGIHLISHNFHNMAVLLLLTALALTSVLCFRINKSVSYESPGKIEAVRHDAAFTLGSVSFRIAEHIRRRRRPGQLGQRGATPEPGLRP